MSGMEVFPLDKQLDEDDLRSFARLESLTLGVAKGPVLAGNQISISAHQSANTRIAGVVFENHIHYGSTSSDEQSDSCINSREIFSSLVSHYTNQYSWMTAWDGGPRFSTEDLYVGLKMHPMNRSGRLKQGDARKKKILFEPFSRTGVTPRTVLVRGDPGFGKTTLCRKIAYDWAGTGKTFPGFRSERTVVLYQDMAALQEDAILENELLLLAVQKESAGADELEEAKRNLTSFGRNVILVLDGYVGIGAGLREQVNRLVASACPPTTFCDASVVVMTRPDVDEETLSLFQKNFFIKGFSVPMSCRIVDKYFKQTTEASGIRCMGFLQRYQLKGLAPSAILALCRCDTTKSNAEEILQEWIFRLVQSSGQQISDEGIRSKIERLGEFFWKRNVKRRCDFSLQELESNFGSDCRFFLNCRLLKTAGIGTGGEQLVWEPVEKVLSEEIAAFYVRRCWASCLNHDQIPHFLNNLFPRLPCLNVDCALDSRDGGTCYSISFRYRDYHLTFIISERGRKCFVRTNASSVTTDEAKQVLEMSFLISLRKKQDAEEVVGNLCELFKDSGALSWLSRFLSPSRFESVCLRLTAEETSFANSLFERTFDLDDFTIPHPLASLRRRGREFHSVFIKEACESGFVSTALKAVLDIEESSLVFGDGIDIMETLKRTEITPPFQAAHLYGQQYLRKMQGPKRRLCDRLELFFHADSKTDEYCFD